MTVDVAIVPLVGHWPLGVPCSGEVTSLRHDGFIVSVEESLSPVEPP
jgi:hypothetical protein